jgi:hypothetical protein
LPDPFGPMMPMRSPSETVNEMLRNSGSTPNRFAKPRALMIGAKSCVPLQRFYVVLRWSPNFHHHC